MTEKPNSSQKSTVNLTAHHKAMANSKVQALVKALRDGWESIGTLERTKRLIELTALGCSQRGLEKELKQPATKIRRHIGRGLPEQREADTPPPLVIARMRLEQMALDEAEKRRKQRLKDDEETGAVSDKIATIVFEFCRGQEGLPDSQILKADLQVFLDSAENQLNYFEANHFREIQISKGISTRKVFELSQPDELEDEFWLVHRGRWVAKIVWAYAPERAIWTRVLSKVRSRKDELDPPPAPLLNYMKRAARQ